MHERGDGFINQITINVKSKTLRRLCGFLIIAVSVISGLSLYLINQVILWVFFYAILIIIALFILVYLLMLSDKYRESIFTDLVMLVIGTTASIFIAILVQYINFGHSEILGEIQDTSDLISAMAVIAFMNFISVFILSAISPANGMIRRHLGIISKDQIETNIIVLKIPGSMMKKYDESFLNNEIKEAIRRAITIPSETLRNLGSINEFSLLQIKHIKIIYRISNGHASILLIPIDGRTIHFEDASQFVKKLDFILEYNYHFEIPNKENLDLHISELRDAYGKLIAPEKKPLLIKVNFKKRIVKYRRAIIYISLVSCLAIFLLIPNPISDYILSDRITAAMLILSIVGGALWAFFHPLRAES